jgi:hypothetical protein
MGIEKLWDRLEPDTQQWLIDNPGCKILPRAVVAAIIKSTGAEFKQDQHGEDSPLPQRLRLHPQRSGPVRGPAVLSHYS